MGLNIHLYGEPKSAIDAWDSMRFAGDRDIGKLVSELPIVQRNAAEPPDYELEFRPADFAAWRKVAAEREWPNPNRLPQLLDILEANPNVWIYLSY